MERLAAAAVPRVAHRALATLPAARPPPAAVATHRDPSFCARGFAARGRFFAGRPRATHARWTATPEASRRGDRRLAAAPRVLVETETSEAETAADDESVAAPGRARAISLDASADVPAGEETRADGSDANPGAKRSESVDDGSDAAKANPLSEALDGLADAVATATTKIRGTANRLRSTTRAATHPPLPVVSTFDELLRFARVASLNSAPRSEIEQFFAQTDETVVVLEMPSVKQRLFIATDDKNKRHTISFRGTTNLTNVVQNIRLSNNPVTASGRLASVGRSLSGAFSGLRVSGRRETLGRSKTDDTIGADAMETTADDDARSSNAAATDSAMDPDSSSDSDSGSFDEDDDDGATSAADAEACANIDWSSATPESLARLGCTDHLPMHRGYRIIARECADALAPLMTPGYSVQLTGHSLGGAVAVAVALLFRSRGLAVTKVVTFGAPKLGPRETRDAAEPLDILRVVQKDDLIPLLPMSRPFVRKPYVHLGEGVVLDNDAPGRYARLSKEWGTAGILWKQRRHTGYARGANDERPSAAIEANGVAGDPLVAARPSPERAEGAEETEGASAFVSADEPDELEALSASDERARRGRFHAARERLRRLRAALGEGIARRRAAFAAASGAGAEADARAGPARDAGAGEVPASVPASDSASVPASVTDDEGARAFAREVAAWASSDAEASDERPSSVAASSDESSADESSADASAAEGRRSGSSRWSLFKRARSADPAPFDDVEGELFVRVAETTPFGGASDVAAAAADEWERAAAATETGPPRRKSVSAGGDPRAGPTIFEELWKLRGLDAEARGNRLESHRMRRYVEEIQRAIDAGPVQTSLAGVYAGKEGDEVGLDFSDDAFAGDGEDGAVEGGVASWMTWSR